MKQLFYFILLIAGFSSIHSCKDLVDEEGNPLLDLNNTGGLTGPRALYREITDKDTIAEYRYSGLLLNTVITDSASITNVMYSGDKISQINFNGFLDLDGNSKLDKDSISFERLLTYNNTGRLEKITEKRSVFRRPPPVPPATTPGPQTLLEETTSMYQIKYTATTGKLESIRMEKGPAGASFNSFTETTYTYVGDNISKVVKHYGPIAGGTPGPVDRKYSYEYYAYDNEISPFTLLPWAYKISRLLNTDFNDKESLILSPNNPKRWSFTDLTPPIPNPIVKSTNYVYDPQTYMTKGFGINYIYKPQ
ncbi:hypothetical protein DRF59_03160 [Chryseobacterium flavum]|uniref:DUF4595 domain-containing protein n=1 Tax=Chryseobacterium flavum TaxID=415851 RepID=A0A3D9CT42_9FLAO|nr:hypothetical protein [Chryseobacterium flavum]REC68904.1 hypothetical protein DRF59_03160 [Chryseobacterium flavum]